MCALRDIITNNLLMNLEVEKKKRSCDLDSLIPDNVAITVLTSEIPPSDFVITPALNTEGKYSLQNKF